MKKRNIAASLFLSLFTLWAASPSAQAFTGPQKGYEPQSPASREEFYAEDRNEDLLLPTLRPADLEVSVRILGREVLEVVVENIGRGYAPPSLLSVRQELWSQGRFQIRAIPELFPGEVETFTISDRDFDLFCYRTFVEADAFDDVYELDEGNNFGELGIKHCV